MSAAKRLPAPEHYVEAASAAVARMGRANRRDPGRVTRNREPVVDRGADLAALDWRLARPMVAGDQQDEAITGVARAFDGKVDCTPGAVQAVAVEIHDPVRLEGAGAKPPVPGSVERGSNPNRSGLRRFCPGSSWRYRLRRDGLRRLRRPGLLRLLDGFARQGPDGRGYPGPELGLVRAE